MRLRLTSLARLALASAALVWAAALAACGGGEPRAAAPAWDPPALPETPAGRQLAAYVEVLNRGDTEAVRSFVAERFTPVGPGGSDIAARTSAQLRFLDSSRGLNLYRVVDAGEAAITVVAQLRLTAEWREIMLEVEPAPPHRISGIRIQPAEAPSLAAAGPLTDAQAAEQLGAYLRDLAAADRFSGVVLVARDGAEVFGGAYGMADAERGIPNRLDTRFGLASAGKMFTAVAVAQLAEQGRLRYDDPIGRFLPDYPADAARRVTIHHLLTHTSGVPDFFADLERFEVVRLSRDPQRDYQALFRDEPLRFEPGARVEYSNSNFILLGAIVEAVSGERYEDYLRAHIFGPAGMRETGLSAEGVAPDLRALGYTQMTPDGRLQPGPRRLVEGLEPAVGSAAGGAYSTARDMLRFGQALREGRLLGQAATEQLLADRADAERPGYRYAYGFVVRRVGAERVVGHSGGFPGVDAQLELYLERGVTVVVLANYELVAEPVLARAQQLTARGG